MTYYEIKENCTTGDPGTCRERLFFKALPTTGRALLNDGLI